MIKKRSLSIATIVSVGLLVLAANLQPQPARFWILICGWPLLAWCVWMWSAYLHEDSPYRGGFIFAIFLLVILGVIERGLSPFFKLVFEPSGKHLYSFLTSKAFLGSAVVYFASVCVFYRGQLQELREDLRYCRELLNRNLAEENNESDERPPD